MKSKTNLKETEKKLQNRTDDSRLQKTLPLEKEPQNLDKGDKAFQKVYCYFKRKTQRKTLVIKI